jgi:isopenicillin-N N-acyltransferase like protein
MRDRMLRTILWVLGIVTVLIVLVLIYARAVSTVPPPEVSLLDTAAVVQEPVRGLHKYGNNWFRRSESGLYELYVEGKPFERGVANGKLTRDLVQYQEVAFTSQIQRLVPNGFYRGMLKYFIGWFNRDLPAHVIDEYKQEIYGVSQAASHSFDDIGEPYQRILNYHAAHDIGHALQNMSLVGCTAFATWNERSQDST